MFGQDAGGQPGGAVQCRSGEEDPLHLHDDPPADQFPELTAVHPFRAGGCERRGGQCGHERVVDQRVDGIDRS